jgi:hypothetical protein
MLKFKIKTENTTYIGAYKLKMKEKGKRKDN